MKKTFWSVTYSVWGANEPLEAWFDDKSEAVEFADADYRDKPVRHAVSKPETIRHYDELVARTRYYI